MNLGLTDQTPPEAGRAIEARLRLEGKFKSGATWFYWIAGLSIVNSIAVFFGAQWSFIFGLGITQTIDAIVQAAMAEAGPQGAAVLAVIVLVMDLVGAGIFVLFGWLALRGRRGAHVTGMVVYSLDALIFLLVEDYIGIAFHAFALFGMWGGLAAWGQLRRLPPSVPTGEPPPWPPP